jgi:hypothetical protein
MKELIYTYEVVETSTEKRTITVLYTSEGRESVTTEIRYPYVGEDLDLLLQRYSPVTKWVDDERTLGEVVLGTKKEIIAHFPDFV